MNPMGWKMNICPAWSCRPHRSSANMISVPALCPKLNKRALAYADFTVTANYLFEENKI